MKRSRPDGIDERALRAALALLRHLLPVAEQEEVLADLVEEYRERAERDGRGVATVWVWRQVLASAPSVVRRSWLRGWSGFEPRANRMRPGGSRMERWIMDARYAARRLRSRPAYALLAILTLALGVGGTAAIYSIVRHILIDPLPYSREERIAAFWNAGDWSQAELVYLGPNMPGFQKVAGYRSSDLTVEGRGGSPRLVRGVASTAGLFDVLGVRPQIGRGFQPGDDQQGVAPVAVLSYGFWRELGGDPAIVGQRLRLDGVVREVVGVMPKGFWFPDPTVRVWVTTALDPQNRAGNYALVGRLAPGMEFGGMEAPLARITAALGERFQYTTDFDKTRNATLTPLRESMMGQVRPALLATLGAMGVILLIACANVAALMLGQVAGRSTEFAVRSALGAVRRRLIQQLVMESLLVGVLAGGAGAALAAGSFHVLLRALPLGALADNATLDWSVFAAAMVVAVLASLGISLVPGIALWRGDLQGRINRMRTGGLAGCGGRLEGGLVVAEVALAIMMAAGAALLIRSVANLRAIDPGIDTRGIAVVDIASGSEVTPEQERLRLRELVPALRDLPGVRSAAAVQKFPLRGSGDNWGIEVEGRPDLAPTSTAFRIVTPGYLRTLGVHVVAGRLFDASDRPESERVVVINEALARKYFAGTDPIGRRISTGFGGYERIIGVVTDVAESNLTDEAVPARYMLYDQISYTPRSNTLVLRLQPGQSAAAVLKSARATIARVAPEAAIQQSTTVESVFSLALGPARQVMALLTLLGALALVLGAVGVYGTISHAIGRRKRDLAIRIALGMRPLRVVTQVVAQGGMLVAAGSVLGIAAFLLLARILASFLYGVDTADPGALAGAVVALLLVGLVAAFIPAYRASRIDPALVLREQ
jgi:predicted permease